MEVPDILIVSGDKAITALWEHKEIPSISHEFAQIQWIKTKKWKSWLFLHLLSVARNSWDVSTHEVFQSPFAAGG